MSLHSNTLCIQPFFHSYSLMLFVKQRRRISLSYWIPKNICKTKSCKYLLTAFIIWNKHRKCEDKINIISLFNITFQSTLYHCRYFVSLNLQFSFFPLSPIKLLLNFTTSNTEHDWCRIRKISHPSRAPESNTHFFWWGLSCWSFFPFLFCFMCCAYCFLCVRYASCGQCCLFLDCPFLIVPSVFSFLLSYTCITSVDAIIIINL